jgi:hypothetical protein
MATARIRSKHTEAEMVSRIRHTSKWGKIGLAVALVLLVWLLFTGTIGGCGSGSGGNTAYASADENAEALYLGYGDSDGGLAVADDAPGPAELEGSGDPPQVDWWNWGSEQDFCSDNAPDAIYDCLADPT